MGELKLISRLGLAICILLVTTRMPLTAAGPRGAPALWDNLKQLRPGQQIKVVLNDAKSFQGKFQSVSDEALVVRLATGEQNFMRQSILRVSSRGQSHRWRNAAIGAAVGAGAGLGIGAAVDASSKCSPTASWCFNILPNGGKEILTPLGGIIGAIVGVVVPSGGWREVYRAR